MGKLQEQQKLEQARLESIEKKTADKEPPIAQALIHYVEIHPDGAVIHYRLGQRSIAGEPRKTGSPASKARNGGPAAAMLPGAPAYSSFNDFQVREPLTNGGPRPATTELTPLVRLSFDMRWIRRTMDLRELVTLWRSGKSMGTIARSVGVSRTTVFRRLKALEKET